MKADDASGGQLPAYVVRCRCAKIENRDKPLRESNRSTQNRPEFCSCGAILYTERCWRCGVVNIHRTRQRLRDGALRRHARVGLFASQYWRNVVHRKVFQQTDAKRPRRVFPRKAWEQGARGGVHQIGRCTRCGGFVTASDIRLPGVKPAWRIAGDTGVGYIRWPDEFACSCAVPSRTRTARRSVGRCSRWRPRVV